jgi:hypothetical protein
MSSKIHIALLEVTLLKVSFSLSSPPLLCGAQVSLLRKREATGRGRTLSVAGQKLFCEHHRPQMGMLLFRAAISPACEMK